MKFIFVGLLVVIACVVLTEGKGTGSPTGSSKTTTQNPNITTRNITSATASAKTTSKTITTTAKASSMVLPSAVLTFFLGVCSYMWV